MCPNVRRKLDHRRRRSADRAAHRARELLELAEDGGLVLISPGAAGAGGLQDLGGAGMG